MSRMIGESKVMRRIRELYQYPPAVFTSGYLLLVSFIVCLLILVGTTGCIATAPISFAWRSNSTQQYATTEGKTDSKSEGASVNAEKTSTLDTNVNTGTQETADREADVR